MKLQKLLNNHRDKLWEGYFVTIELSSFDNDIVLHCRYESAIYPEIKPLSELLFSTPFLSLLEWKEYEGDCYDKYTKYESKASNQENDYRYESYHKINLVLLTTDIERIKYVEEFTL